MKTALKLAVSVAFGAALANAGTIAYTCDASINSAAAGTCAYLNSTIAGLYSSTFTNAGAKIYIEQTAAGGLGSSTQVTGQGVSFNAYYNLLNGNASKNALQASAVNALNTVARPVYGGGNVDLTSAFLEDFGIGGGSGVTSALAICSLGTAGCYDGIINIVTLAGLSAETGGTQTLYWDQQGGLQPGNAYDFYSVVEHETDELLGTTSAVGSNGTAFSYGGTPNPSDLFRYNAGSLVPDSSLSQTPGAYFSYDGGFSNGANGATFDSLPSQGDYADFAQNCHHVQDSQACLGSRLDITTDGNAEINILNAIGYDVTATPEPGTLALFGAGLAALCIRRRHRRS